MKTTIFVTFALILIAMLVFVLTAPPSHAQSHRALSPRSICNGSECWTWRVEESCGTTCSDFSEVQWTNNPGNWEIKDRSKCKNGTSSEYTYSGIVTAVGKWDAAKCSGNGATWQILDGAKSANSGGGWQSWYGYWAGG